MVSDVLGKLKKFLQTENINIVSIKFSQTDYKLISGKWNKQDYSFLSEKLKVLWCVDCFWFNEDYKKMISIYKHV